MRELWPTILGVVLTSTLWGMSGQWEWTVPKSVERKIIDWKRKWYWSQINIRMISNGPIEDLEQFAWSLKTSLPKLQRELGVPVRLEIEWKEPESLAVLAEYGMEDTSDYIQEVRQQLEGKGDGEGNDLYFSCLSRCFPELFWVGQTECE